MAKRAPATAAGRKRKVKALQTIEDSARAGNIRVGSDQFKRLGPESQAAVRRGSRSLSGRKSFLDTLSAPASKPKKKSSRKRASRKKGK